MRPDAFIAGRYARIWSTVRRKAVKAASLKALATLESRLPYYLMEVMMTWEAAS